MSHFLIVMLSVAMLNVIVLSVIIKNVVTLNVVTKKPFQKNFQTKFISNFCQKSYKEFAPFAIHFLPKFDEIDTWQQKLAADIPSLSY